MNMSGIRDWGLGICVATAVTLGPPVLFAQNPADPTMRPRPAVPTNPARPTNPAQPGSASVASVSPIECWWKTDRSAVRVGENFTLTLTCAVLDTERVKVVVDETGLAPSALHLVPFDIVGGERFRDILNAPRRFFQYQYVMRVLGEEFFGREISLPRLQISYRVQNSLQGGTALQGREAHYSLVPVPIRVLSLVPAGAADIRDTPVDTFGDVDARLFRSNLLLILAGVAFVLAGLMVVMLVARAAVKRHATAATRHRAMSPGAVLHAASRELGAVQAASQSGWNGELAGRAAAALRLAGAVALSRPVSHKLVDRNTPPTEGQVVAAPGLSMLRGKKIVLSASVTPDTTALNGSSASALELWKSLSQPLGAFTAVRYSRPSTHSTGSGSTVSSVERATSSGQASGIDGTALDAALAEGRDVVRRLRLTQWRRFGRSRRHVETTTTRQTWAR
jgi:hypothetical protein